MFGLPFPGWDSLESRAPAHTGEGSLGDGDTIILKRGEVVSGEILTERIKIRLYSGHERFIEKDQIKEIYLAERASSSEETSLIYENGLASVYPLPLEGTSAEVSEEAASFILEQLAQKGLTGVLVRVAPVLVSKLAGLFLTFITEMPEVGIPTSVDIVMLAQNDIINIVQADRDFLSLIIVRAGNCFDYGVLLTFEHFTGLSKWETVRQVKLLSFEELHTLYQKGLLQYGDGFVVVPKEPSQLSAPGKYRLSVRAWCASEGRSSYKLSVLEASAE